MSRAVLLLCAALSCVTAQPITVGNVRITILTSLLVRVEHSNLQQFEDRPSLTFPLRSWIAPDRVVVTDNTTSVFTASLRVDVSHEDRDGVLCCDTLKITLLDSGNVWCPDNGTTSLNNLNGSLSTTDCYASTPDECIAAYEGRMFPGLLSRDQWHVVDDSTTSLLSAGWIVPRPLSSETTDLGYADLTFVTSSDKSFRHTLSDVVSVTGRVQLLPWRAYGTWLSRYWPYTQDELEATLDGFSSRSLPLAMLVVDMDWHKAGTATVGCGPTHPAALQQCGEGFGGYSWNTSLFPAPSAFLDGVHSRGLQVMANIHNQCGIDHCQANFSAVAAIAGINASSRAVVPCAFSSQRYVDSLYSYELRAPGPNQLWDYFWEDLGLNGVGAELGCTGELHCQTCLGDLTVGASPMGDHPSALWTAAVHVDEREAAGLRGMTLGIFGGLGHHRYGVVGSGDTLEAWETLRWQVYATVSAANVLVAWTHDLGGFYPEEGKGGCSLNEVHASGASSHDNNDFLPPISSRTAPW